MADAVPPHEAAFEAQFAYMVGSIDAEFVATACVRAGLISEWQHREWFPGRESGEEGAILLLNHVKMSIKGNRTKFDTFVEILNETGHSRQAAKLSELSEYWHALINKWTLIDYHKL